MARSKSKWKFAFILYLVSLSVVTKSLPLTSVKNVPLISDTLTSDDSSYVSIETTTYSANNIENYVVKTIEDEIAHENDNIPAKNETNNEGFHNTTLLRNEPVRPGQIVRDYAIEITVNGDSFDGRAIIRVELTTETREDTIIFNADNMDIRSVNYGIVTLTNPLPADFSYGDGLLEIDPPLLATSFIFLIEYTGSIGNGGLGLYQGSFGDATYLAMNFHPTYARRVFPCMDEPTQESTITFTFNNIGHTHIMSNSIIDESSVGTVQFTALQGPPHRWGLLAHSFININNPFIGGRLYVRNGIANQDSQASVIINAVYSRLEEWTTRPLTEIQQNQNEYTNIVALPDITKNWYALGTVPIWEPYILMTSTHAISQRRDALIKIPEAIARQWFGYVVFPENWRYQWINDGLATHAAYEAARAFQGQALDFDNTVIDINAIFIADVLQEALLRDGYSTAQPLEPDSDLFDESIIRDQLNGLVKYKAPAIMWLLKTVLGQTDNDPTVDYLQTAARALLNSRSLQTFNTLNFYDAINSEWLGASNQLIDDIPDFLEPYIQLGNYPVLSVQLRTSGVIVTQERFAFTTVPQVTYQVPFTYTSSINPNFEDTTVQAIMDNNLIIDLFLDEEDWFLANIQGQGYYRVNYDWDLWDRIILALEDPDSREVIHPLNRATLVDDALNLARAGKLDYDIAFRVVLTMEHETHYAVWKAFIRNMEFLRTRFFALIANDGDEDFDPDIYLRMVRRSIVAVERDLGFYPDPLIIEDSMASLTRGLVMEHACKTKYSPCVAAAIDWFYNPDSSDLVVNPNIPHDIRPAVYCTMMREGDETARDALWAQYEAETTVHERLVIARAMGCSSDQNYLNNLLQDTVVGNDPFGVEERSQFFISMIRSSYENAELALNFIRRNTAGIRNMYGGPEKLEEIIYVLAENCADYGLAETFEIWINSINSDLDDSVDAALRASAQANEDLVWIDVHMDYVYEWIDENDAHTVAASIATLLFGLVIVMLQ